MPDEHDPYDHSQEPDDVWADGDDDHDDHDSSGQAHELDQTESHQDDLSFPSDQVRPEVYEAAPTYVNLACIYCGYNLTGVSIGGVCPECGKDVDASIANNINARTLPNNGMAITSMVIGIVSLVGTCCCPAGLTGIVGLVFGIVAMNQISTGRYNSASKGMAIAGIVCSSIAMLIGIVWFGFMILGSL